VRGLTISAHGGLEQLELRDDLDVPDLVAPTDVRVRIHAAALNRLDLWVLGGMPGVSITPKWIVGGDGAGVVDAVGSAVIGLAPGDRVFINPGVSCRQCEYCLRGEQPLCPKFRLLGEHLPGTLADFVVVPEANLRTIPDGIPWEAAAAFPLATLTAWRMVVTRANVTARDQVLVWGIGGGVALAALRIAKRRGATVWVTSGSDEKLAWAQALGADHVLNHRTADVAGEIRARTGKRGVDVVIDSVGETTWEQSLRALGRAGRLVTCGGTSGHKLLTDVRRLFWNQWTIMGSTMGSDGEFDAVTAELRAGHLTPVVDSVFPLDEGRKAYERLQGGEQFGKVVIRVA
jgi:NADPH:quinone reductase-like Zn-dependent oxidoreductase